MKITWWGEKSRSEEKGREGYGKLRKFSRSCIDFEVEEMHRPYGNAHADFPCELIGCTASFAVTGSRGREIKGFITLGVFCFRTLHKCMSAGQMKVYSSFHFTLCLLENQEVKWHDGYTVMSCPPIEQLQGID
ncbi:hypothetical protein SUGI_0150160 [Cryptomeria japonica]|nr:hypothetical protein SUGI_0150160 [Cryptomeria japonica]